MSSALGLNEIKLWTGEPVWASDAQLVYYTGLLRSTGGILSKIRKPKISYILTNKRALAHVQHGDQNVTLQCELALATVSVINRAKEEEQNYHPPPGKSHRNFGYTRVESHSLGDVIFFAGGKIATKFIRVEDPDGVLNIVNGAISALRKI
jgi:hypothetical protein